MELDFLKSAVKTGRKTLSEYESKKLLAAYGVRVVEEELAATVEEACAAAARIGFPVAMKACGAAVTHKTEKKLVELGVGSPGEVEKLFAALEERAGGGIDGVLVQKMVKGSRELVAGLIRDNTFGPCVMFGLGGIYTELLKDVSFRVAPLEPRDALEMMSEIKSADILGSFRGMPPVDKEQLAAVLIALGRLGLEHPEVAEIDINPLIITADGTPVAVDALVALKKEE